MRELHLFAGAGGGILGGMLLGHTPVGAVEIDPFARAVLHARQADGSLPDFPIYDDVRTFDGTQWRDRVDIIAGGFPCQDLSVAGKGAGIDGARSGLWWEMLRVIREARPRYIFLENVPAITGRGLDRVLGSLADLGLDAEWLLLSAADAGAPHLRKRWWCLARHADGATALAVCSICQRSFADAGTNSQAMADADDAGREQQRRTVAAATARTTAERSGPAHTDTDGRRCEEQRQPQQPDMQCEPRDDPDGLRSRGQWQGAPGCAEGLAETEPRMGRAANGLAAWLDAGRRLQASAWPEGWEDDCPRVVFGKPANRTNRLKALGNGQVPQTAAAAFRILWERLHR